MSEESWVLLASILVNGAITIVSLVFRHKMPNENGKGGDNGKT